MPDATITLARWGELADRTAVGASVDGVDLVLVRDGEALSVFEGRCPHRGALLADGSVIGPDLVCGVHGCDFRLDSGISADNPTERLRRFAARVSDGDVVLDAAELDAFRRERPQTTVTAVYDRLFDDVHAATPEEPFVGEIHELARHGLSHEVADLVGVSYAGVR
jgi:methylamine---glutamate N-methyltransferase subunit C